MVHIIHRVGIKAPISKVYEALSTPEGVASWWTKSTTGSGKVGGLMTVRFNNPEGKEIGHMTMETVALEPNKSVHWRFTDGPNEWLGTDVVYSLSQEGEYVIVNFAHKNWREAIEFTAHCSTKWAIFMMSLKELCETGKGRPSPIDIKIDNWN